MYLTVTLEMTVLETCIQYAFLLHLHKRISWMT
jgi:hypothetical protein